MAILPEAQDDVLWVSISDPPRTHPPNTKSTFGSRILEYTGSRTFVDVAFWCLITLKSPTNYFVGQILLQIHINLYIFTDVAFRCLITLKSLTSYFVDQFFCISLIIVWICSSYPSRPGDFSVLCICGFANVVKSTCFQTCVQRQLQISIEVSPAG